MAATSSLALAGILGTSGVLHFVTPAGFRAIVPRALPAPGLLVAASGVAEIVCAGLLAAPATRRAGGRCSAALLVAVFPANISMALQSRNRSRRYQAAVWARLPLQIPLIVAAWRSA